MSNTREAVRRIRRSRQAAVGSQARDKQEPKLWTARPISDRHNLKEILHKINERFERLRFEIRRVEAQSTPLVEDVTISSGSVTVLPAAGPRIRVITVDTEGAVATDDLDTIDGTTLDDVVIVQSTDDSRDVRLTNSGNLNLGPFGAFSLLTANDRATFHSDGTNLNAISLRNN